MADARGLGPRGVTLAGSSPVSPTNSLAKAGLNDILKPYITQLRNTSAEGHPQRDLRERTGAHPYLALGFLDLIENLRTAK